MTANNATGFSAVPAGNCYGSLFYSAGNYAEFGSSTQYGSGDAWYRCLDRSSADVNRSSSGKNEGFSVRCLRD